MQKRNILIGNGININFGGEDYTNGKIIERLTKNITTPSRYDEVFCGIISADELLRVITGLNDVFNKMINQSIFALSRTENKEEMRDLIDISRRYKGKNINFLMLAWKIIFS